MKHLGQIITSATELGLTMGLTAAGLVLAGLFLGRWIDARLGTGPMALIVCTLAGAIASQIALVRLARSSAKHLANGGAARIVAREALSSSGVAVRALFYMVAPGLAGLGLGLLLGGSRPWLIPVLAAVGFVVGLGAAVSTLRRSGR